MIIHLLSLHVRQDGERRKAEREFIYPPAIFAEDLDDFTQSEWQMVSGQTVTETFLNCV